MKTGSTAEAEREFEAALRISDGTSPEAHFGLGELRAWQWDLVSAAEHFEMAKGMSAALQRKGYSELVQPKSVVQGIRCVLAGEYEAAIRVLESGNLSRNAVACFFLGQANEELNRHNAAMTFYRRVLQYERA